MMDAHLHLGFVVPIRASPRQSIKGDSGGTESRELYEARRCVADRWTPALGDRNWYAKRGDLYCKTGWICDLLRLLINHRA